MKKIILSLIVLMLASMVFAGSYNSDTEKLTLNLEKGWNLVPLDTIEFNRDNLLATCNAQYSFVYDVMNKNYLSEDYRGWDEFSSSYSYDIISRSGVDYAYSTNPTFGAAWIYLNSPCSLSTYYGRHYDYAPKFWTEENKQSVGSLLKLVEGWNFLTINPLMIGNTYQLTFENCNIVAGNVWNESTQNWGYLTSSNTPLLKLNQNTAKVSADDVGQVLVLKVSGECNLNYKSETTGPPALPN
jgi:hypothetical protein